MMRARAPGSPSVLAFVTLALAGALGGGGCGGAPGLHAAEAGDRASLHDTIAAHETKGDLSNGAAADLAAAVASHELREASAADAPGRIRDALPCAHELDAPLADRMRVHDAAGADAALARIDGRGLSLADARAYASDPDAAWRAVGARGLVRAGDREGRLRSLADDAPAVRRQAVRAARDAADPDDLRVLAETARLDPEPIVRTEAVRAIAAMDPSPGGAAVDVLRDLWTGGDDGLREDIAIGWASPRLWDAGGREALRIRVAAGHGPGAIEAAAAVLRHAGRGASSEPGDDVFDAAAGQLVRAIATGSRRTRLQALAEAPLDRADVRDAVRAASTDEDPEVRVGALARVMGPAGSLDAAGASSAVTALEALAQPGSPVASRARFALAVAGDRRVQGWLETDLGAPAPEDRLGAATALASLGVSARAAPLLADADPSVRVRSACTILMAARAGR
ncbi:MAG TPA: HEAT repeat domain-containing protein [Polyangiaceae bacterium]|jgi:hypothetical protein|nr:HEAT repeat domain-containing protein [Polyangiaceae bacterium]